MKFGASADRPTRTAVLETLSLQPLVLGIDGFLSKDECTHVIEEATPYMAHSKVGTFSFCSPTNCLFERTSIREGGTHGQRQRETGR
jgi:hypothetical protein